MRRLIVVALACAIAPALYAGPALRVYYSSGSQVSLNWTLVSGAASYTIERTSAFPAWSLQQVVSGISTSWSQSGLAANTTYLYRVVPKDGSGNPVGTPSNVAVVNTHAYSSNPLIAGAPTSLQHLVELRTAVASMRTAAGAGSAVWTRTPSIDSFITKEDIADLRTNFNAACANLGLPLPSYEDPVLLAEMPIRRVHLQQVRDLARTYPELVFASSVVVSEPYFSPNGDGAKDTTTFSANVGFASGAQRVDFRWRVDVRNSANAVVKSAFGSGTAVSVVWDGKDAAGITQPEGLYAFELVDLGSLSNPVVNVSARIDLTPPTAAIATPADDFVVSNVRMAGGGSLPVTGSATDTYLQQWTLERTGNSQSAATISIGTSNVTSGALGTWQTLTPSIPNGSYTLKLTATDKAANTTVDDVPVTVGHFSVSRSVAQANSALNEVVTYTSVVPFPLTLRIDIWSGSSIVRTLANESKAAGTHVTTWNDLQSFADGGYKYIATATEGANTLTWDKSSSYPGGPATTQFEYPKCWTGSMWTGCEQMPAGFDFDPYAGKPLRIAYCVGTGQPDSCTAAGAYVLGKATVDTETNDQYDANSIFDSIQAGRQELLWFGMGNFGYLGDRPRMTILRKFTSIPDSMTVLYGTTPLITNVTISPAIFSPPSAPTYLTGQTFTVTASVFNNRSYSATVTFRNMESGAILRTMTTASQTSGPITFTWDGRADDPLSTLVAPGLYDVRIVVKDSVGSYAVTRPIVVVRY